MVKKLGAGGLFFILLFVPSELSYNHIVPPWQHYYPRVLNQWTSKAGRPERFRAGQGRFRMLPRGVELLCDFPPSFQILSNVIWERADLGVQKSLDEMYKSVGETREYTLYGRPHGSTLFLHNLSNLDRGLYRCIATALDTKSARVLTLFQDVPFFPGLQTKGFIPLSPPCCRKNYNDFRHQLIVKSSSLYVS